MDNVNKIARIIGKNYCTYYTENRVCKKCFDECANCPQVLDVAQEILDEIVLSKHKIIFVEDGSVDIDKLEEQVGNIAHIVVYRQGVRIPQIVEV